MKKVFVAAIVLCVGLSLSHSVEHSQLRTTSLHSPYRWTFADSTTRVNASVVAADTGKKALQYSDTTEWVLIDNDPKTWRFVGGKTVDSLFVKRGFSCATISTGNGQTEIPVMASGTFSCSLFTGSTYLAHGTAFYIKLGNTATIRFPYLTGTSVSGVTLKGFPAAITPSADCIVPVGIITSTGNQVGFLSYSSSVFALVTSEASALDSGDAGMFGNQVVTIYVQ